MALIVVSFLWGGHASKTEPAVGHARSDLTPLLVEPGATRLLSISRCPLYSESGRVQCTDVCFVPIADIRSVWVVLGLSTAADDGYSRRANEQRGGDHKRCASAEQKRVRLPGE